MAKDPINLTTEGVEVPKEFEAAFNEIKSTALAEPSQEQPVKRGRGRPRKSKDEVVIPEPHDEADRIIAEDTKIEEPEESPDAEPLAEEEIEELEDKSAEQKPAAEEYIPDTWVDAGRKAGMSDETIQALAAESPDTLRRLAGEKQESPAIRTPQVQPEFATPRREQELFEPISVKLDADEHGEEVVKVIDALVKRVNDQTTVMKQLRDQQNAVRAETAARSVEAMENKFDSILDKLSAELPSVGKSDSFKNGEFETRKSIWNVAETLRKGNPRMRFEDSVEDAIAWYRGKQGRSAIKKEIVTQLKARASKLTYAPTHRQPTAPVHKTEADRAVAEIDKIKARYEL